METRAADGETDRQLADLVGEDAAQGLARWRRTSGWTVSLPAAPWTSRGYTDAFVASLVLRPPGGDDLNLVAKVVPQDNRREPDARRRAFDDAAAQAPPDAASVTDAEFAQQMIVHADQRWAAGRRGPGHGPVLPPGTDRRRRVLRMMGALAVPQGLRERAEEALEDVLASVYLPPPEDGAELIRDLPPGCHALRLVVDHDAPDRVHAPHGAHGTVDDAVHHAITAAFDFPAMWDCPVREWGALLPIGTFLDPTAPDDLEATR